MATLYPDEYGELFQLAHEHGEFTIPLGSADEARRLRGNLYAYKYWLRRSAHPLRPIADDLEMSIDGPSLVLSLRVPLGVEAIRQAIEEQRDD